MWHRLKTALGQLSTGMKGAAEGMKKHLAKKVSDKQKAEEKRKIEDDKKSWIPRGPTYGHGPDA